MLKTAATITIKDAPRMTKRGRAKIATWLRLQSRYLERGGHKYAKLFVARWQYEERRCGRKK